MSLPEGYGSTTESGVTAFALASAMEWMASVVGQGETLYGWASTVSGREELAGRGVVYSVPAPTPGPDGSHRWVVRHYQRGGFIAPFLGDRYLTVGEPRPYAEAIAAGALRARGVPTPSVVAGAVYRAGLFYRADLVTELVPGGLDLADALFGVEREETELSMRVAGRLVARLEAVGVHHADLNAKNILLRKSSSALHAYVLDLDRCRMVVPGSAVGHGAMRRRLERSLRKFEGISGQPLADSAWEAFRDGWQGGP